MIANAASKQRVSPTRTAFIIRADGLHAARD